MKSSVAQLFGRTVFKYYNNLKYENEGPVLKQAFDGVDDLIINTVLCHRNLDHWLYLQPYVNLRITSTF